MATRTKHQELEDEIGVLRDEVRNIGKSQENLQTQFDLVHVRLEKVDVLEKKIDSVEELLVKNEKSQSTIMDFLQKLDGKISRPISPDTPSSSYVVREQELLLKQHEIENDIRKNARALAEFQLQSRSDVVQLDSPPAKLPENTARNPSLSIIVPEQRTQFKSERAMQFLKILKYF